MQKQAQKHKHVHAVLHTTAYLSFKKAMLSAVRKAATRASGLRIKPNPTIHNSNIKRRKIHTVHMFIIKNENFEVVLLTYREWQWSKWSSWFGSCKYIFHRTLIKTNTDGCIFCNLTKNRTPPHNRAYHSCKANFCHSFHFPLIKKHTIYKII